MEVVFFMTEIPVKAQEKNKKKNSKKERNKSMTGGNLGIKRQGSCFLLAV